MASENESRRKVVSVNVDRFGDVIDVDPDALDPLVLAVERQRRWLVGIVIVLIALLIGVTAALVNVVGPAGVTVPGRSGIGPLVWEQSIYSIGTTADDLLVAPTSVAVGPNGDIYVAEPQRFRVVVFNSGGVFKRSLQFDGPRPPVLDGGSAEVSGTPSGSVSDPQPESAPTSPVVRPESIDVDEFGNLYIADPVAGAVFAFNPEDALMRTFEVEGEARGVHASVDRIYVLGQGRVYIFDSASGEELSWFGSFGSFPGEMDAYQGIVEHEGVIYIADSFNKRIQAFSEKGDLLWVSEAGKGEEPNPLWQLPQDLTIDAAGRIVVVDAMNFELVAIDRTSGVVEAGWGVFGGRDGAFSYPSSVDYDEGRDRFVVADTRNNRIQVVTLPGSTSTVESLAKRATMSPWRYLVIPALVVVASIAVWAGVRALRRRAVRVR